MTPRCTAIALLVLIAVSSAQAQSFPSAVPRGARLFVEQDDFGMALSAAILKKKVPVVIVSDKTTAAFLVVTTSSETKEGQGERVAKVLAFGWGAGNGRHFDATVTVSSATGELVFAHNSKKNNFQSAAENVANELRKHIEQGEKARR